VFKAAKVWGRCGEGYLMRKLRQQRATFERLSLHDCSVAIQTAGTVCR